MRRLMPIIPLNFCKGLKMLMGIHLSVSGTPEIVFTDKDGNEVLLSNFHMLSLTAIMSKISPGVFSALDC